MLSILRKARLKDKEMRVLMLGLDNAGKTTIVKRIMDEDVNTVSPTLGFIIKTIEFQGYKLNIWDVGGQKTLRSYWRNYFEKTDALIWVVDATDRLRIEDCRDELKGLLLEEVLYYHFVLHSIGNLELIHPKAIVWRRSVGILQQDRREWLHEQSRDPNGIGAGHDSYPQMGYYSMQRNNWRQPSTRSRMGDSARQR